MARTTPPPTGGGAGGTTEANLEPIPGWTLATGAAILNESAAGWLGLSNSANDALPGVAISPPGSAGGAGAGWAYIEIDPLADGEAIEMQITMSAYPSALTCAPFVGLGGLNGGNWEGPGVFLNSTFLYQGQATYRSNAIPPWSIITGGGVAQGLVGEVLPFVRFRRSGADVYVEYSSNGKAWNQPQAAAFSITTFDLTRIFIGAAQDNICTSATRLAAWRRT